MKMSAMLLLHEAFHLVQQCAKQLQSFLHGGIGAPVKARAGHAGIQLHVAAEELYPEDYDFSIIFDSVETRKLRHDMERKHVEGVSLELTGAEAERAEMLGKQNK